MLNARRQSHKKKRKKKTNKQKQLLLVQRNDLLNNFSKTQNNKFINLSCAHSMKKTKTKLFVYLKKKIIIYSMTNTKCDRRQF